MNFAEYPALAARTEKPLPNNFRRLEHAALGIHTETGEIATIIKRIAIYGKTLDSIVEKGPDAGKTFRQLLAEEIGDVLWYLPIIESVEGFQVFGCGVPAAAIDLGSKPLVDTLASISRRLVIHAGRVAHAVECIFCGAEDTEADFNLEVRSIVEGLRDLCELIGADITQIAADNIAKLRERYPDAYSDMAAEARADKGGEDARNS